MIPHFDKMKAAYEKITEPVVKNQCADVVSMLAMTMSEERECLKYRMMGNLSTEEIERWGHEYVRHLAGEVVSAFNDLTEETESLKADYIKVARLIVPSQMKHHAE